MGSSMSGLKPNISIQRFFENTTIGNILLAILPVGLAIVAIDKIWNWFF